jgi:hypothetical protein
MKHLPTRPLLALLVCGTATQIAWAASPQACQTASGPKPMAVVELYTSQGCSSCPPADRWLSGLKGQDEVLALAFHVNYWNYLGWRDPYATAETTDRQHRIRAATNGKYVYTPQVVVNGSDYRSWNGQSAKDLPRLAAAQAPAVTLRQQGQQLSATVAASSAYPQLAAYWAVLQDGFTDQVTKGENAGERLRSDHVVSVYQPVAAWSASQAHTLEFTAPAGTDQRVALVVTDSSWTRPVQAVVLRCPS